MWTSTATTCLRVYLQSILYWIETAWWDGLRATVNMYFASMLSLLVRHFCLLGGSGKLEIRFFRRVLEGYDAGDRWMREQLGASSYRYVSYPRLPLAQRR